jgi:cell surface protein SprA
LAYTGKEDDIVRLLEAGDVNFDLPTQLITGTQSLFGIKSELQFGKVNIKTVLSQQRSNKQSKVVENGAEIQNFEIYADQYDVNRHFFLSQYFRDNFEKALKNFPLINSQIQVTQCEVWITNRNAVTQSIRDAVAFQDMGEVKPFSDKILSLNQIMPDNSSNDLFPRINKDENVRNVNTALNQLQTVYGLQSFKDFEKIRKIKRNC